MKREPTRVIRTSVKSPSWFAAGVIRYFQRLYGIDPRTAKAGTADCGGQMVLLELDSKNGRPQLLECHMCPSAQDPYAISVHDVTQDRKSVGRLVATYVHEDRDFGRVNLARTIEEKGCMYTRTRQGDPE